MAVPVIMVVVAVIDAVIVVAVPVAVAPLAVVVPVDPVMVPCIDDHRNRIGRAGFIDADKMAVIEGTDIAAGNPALGPVVTDLAPAEIP